MRHLESFQKAPIDGAKAFSGSPSHGQRKHSRASYKDHCRLSLSASSSLSSLYCRQAKCQYISVSGGSYQSCCLLLLLLSFFPVLLHGCLDKCQHYRKPEGGWMRLCSCSKTFIFLNQKSFLYNINVSTRSRSTKKERVEWCT